MPSKKRKYNARFPAGRIKKIMQTDEEVGKVAQAVPIIISRTLELFVESLLNKAMQVTVSRNAKTLSPSHVKQCILAETRFDFLKDLVKNIPDVSAVEDKETVSADSSPNSSRFPELSAAPRRIARVDSNSSNSSGTLHRDARPPSSDESPTKTKCETVTKDVAIDLTLQQDKPIRTANFYQETLLTDDVPQHSVITKNPIYSNPRPSTSSYVKLSPVEPKDLLIPKTEHKPVFFKDVGPSMFSAPLSRPILTPLRTPTTPILTTFRTLPRSPVTPTGVAMPSTPPVTPILNIDFSKNISNPEIKVLDSSAANFVGLTNETKTLQRQHSETKKRTVEKVSTHQPVPLNFDILNSGNLQIDEDYDT